MQDLTSRDVVSHAANMGTGKLEMVVMAQSNLENKWAARTLSKAT